MVRVEVIKAPTGSGKTQKALEMAKSEKILLAVPTIKLADEVRKRAEEMKLSVVEILGRNNYVCGYKAGLADLNVENFSDYRTDDPILTQDIVCCGRQQCSFDPFEHYRKKIIEENPNLVVTTHELLKASSFKPLFDENRILVIDEIHSFVKSLKNTAEGYRISLQNLLLLLREIEINRHIKSSRIRLVIKKMEKILEDVTPRYSLVFVVSGDGIRTFENTKGDLKEFEGILSFLEKAIQEVRQDTPLKSKHPDVVTLREKLTQMLQTVKNIKTQRMQGFYGYVHYKRKDIELGIRQVLFSPSMWFIFNKIVHNLNPKKIIGMSATISKETTQALFSGSRFDFTYREEPFVFKSYLKMIVFDKPFEYEKRYEHLDFIAEKVKQIKNYRGIVILATSYDDVYYLRDKLSDEFTVVFQKEGEKADDILEAYESEVADVLIGNRSLWEGINIKRDSDFVIVKMPYYSPTDVDFIAIEEYAKRNSYVFNKKEALITLTQGLGRIIRENNKEKRVFVFDNRIKDFAEVLDELPFALKIAVIDCKQKIEPEENHSNENNKLHFVFFHTFKQLQKAVLKKQKVEKKEFGEIFRIFSKKDEKIRSFLGIKEKVRKNRLSIYRSLYVQIVKDFIEIYNDLGIKIDPKTIAEKTRLTTAYIYEILKETKQIQDSDRAKS